MTHAFPSQQKTMAASGIASTAGTRAVTSTMDARNWLTQIRKLDPALLEDAGVRFKGDAMAFPYLAGGEHYADKFRTVEKKFWSTAGISRKLYNFDALTRNLDQPVIITEGEIDCLSILQAGFERVVSLPDGWTKDGNKIDCVLEALEWLRKAPCVIVAGDMDETGESLPRAVSNALEGIEVRAVTWPEGCKDANDVLCDHGEREIVARIQAAKRVDPPGGSITAFSDLPPLSRRRVLRIGRKPFDFRVAFELGAMSVATGTPGSGKSTFVTWAADEIARAENIRVGMMAFETHPHRLRDHLARINTRKPWDDLSVDAQKKLTAELDQRWRIVHRTYDETQHNLGWLKKMVHTLAVRDGCKLIVIDPWNELEHLPEPGENMTSYINFALQQIRVWAEKLEVHILLVAHPRKMMTEGKPRAATGYDVADSAAFANKPSLGFTVFPTKDDSGFEVVELHTWKVRDTQLYGASKGAAQVTFHPELMIYERIGG